ncbi:MAG: hypothetical protein KF820_02685 [Candidatus Paracaedibacteraceae bacterium]|nr:hypothetical protein [Candidatus Paracaedibacteraceae bacterium]
MLFALRLLLEFVLVHSDLRSLNVSVWAIGLYGIIVIAETQSLHINTFILASSILCGIALWELYSSKICLGWADKILLPIIALSIPLVDFGFYLMLVGCLALMTALLWHYYFRMERYPMLPALIISGGIIRVCCG